jgi:U3 small nucleolar RNA-associated protein 4
VLFVGSRDTQKANIPQNEEYITSADLTPLPNNAGFLLAVSTIGEVKFFRLRHPKRGSEVLRVQRVAIPAVLPVKNIDEESGGEDSDDEGEVELADEGARYLKFAPDGRRLLVITPDSRILMVNLDITASSDRKEKPTISISSPVYELDRDLPLNQLQPALKTQQIPSKKRSRQRQDEGTHGDYLHTIVKSSFSSTSRLLAVGDLAGNITTFSLFDGTWSRISTSIPRLPAAPVALSFRPAPTKLQLSASADDNDEDEAPDAELLILPADTQVLHLFSATSGRLTQWSQRNAMPDCLPVEFAAVVDRAVGAFWEGTERAWVFGAAWVWMFDFSRDWPNHSLSFDTVQMGNDGKRKRGAPVGVGSISGAGGRMHQPMGLAQQPQVGEESDSEGFPLSDEESSEHEGASKDMRMKRGQKPYWGSNRYRSLLGFLPVGKREVFEMFEESWEDGLNAVEIVVVERPVWDVGLPPRFFDGKS